MDDEIQEAPQVPAEPPVPEPAPRLSREQLIGALAEEYQAAPEDIAGAIQLREQYARANAEVERKKRELEARERQLQDERERTRFNPELEFADPSQRMLYQMMMEDRAERRKEREERERERENQARMERQADELNMAYESLMARTPTHQRIEPNQFYKAGLSRLYPYGIPEGMAVQQAVDNAARFLGIQPTFNGYQPQPQPFNPRDRRASITIPTGPTAQGGQVNGAIPTEPIGQRDGESLEQYRDRLERYVREQNLTTMNLPEGRRFSSG